MGKETLDTNTFGKSTGKSGNYSTNYQITGRELMTPDEVRMLDNRYALLFIRGERPVMDEKIDILRHPNVRGTTDGKADPYRHGVVHGSIASLVFDEDIDPEDLPDVAVPQTAAVPDGEYELLSEEEVEERFNQKLKEDTPQ